MITCDQSVTNPVAHYTVAVFSITHPFSWYSEMEDGCGLQGARQLFIAWNRAHIKKVWHKIICCD